MKLFISGEVSPDASQGLCESAVTIEDAANPTLLQKHYGATIQTWYFLAIILEEPIPGFRETEYYNSQEHYIEFRRNLDYPSFLKASTEDRCRQLCNRSRS